MTEPSWSEEDSLKFLDLGRYYVPERETQIEIICELVPQLEKPTRILEIGCGAGLLASALLESNSHSKLIGLDGSPTMLRRARQALAKFGDRFEGRKFELAAKDWRNTHTKYHAIVTSLVIHHLDDGEKLALFHDLHAMLVPNGVLVIADLIQPASTAANALAADVWEAAVRQRAQEIDGHLAAYEGFQKDGWNMFRYPDPMDKPSRLFDQLIWLQDAGFTGVDVYWMKAGHVIFGGQVDG